MTPAVPAAPSKKPRTTGAARRDRAIERVTLSERREWQQLHDRELTRFLIERGGRAFLPEDFRHWFAQRGHPAPHHPNVWGGLWMHAAREQLVVKTGKYRQMQARRSHARVTAEWRKA